MTQERGEVDVLLRQLAPQVLGAVLRRHRALDLCEDAVQEALLVAARHWPANGTPDNPTRVADHSGGTAPDRPVAQ